MARAVTLGNGTILVGLDYRGQVRDFYYPYVGQSNHVSGSSGNFIHRIGVFVDGVCSWLDEEAWDVEVGSDPTTVVGSMTARHEELDIELSSIDVVHNEENVFIRSFTLTNLRSDVREVTLFLSQQFRIEESRRGDTSFFDPRVNAIIHYKGTTAFLINAFCNGKQFSDYNIGLFGIENKEGTWHDAFDGVLEHNPIEHGSVDSIIGYTVTAKKETPVTIEYWVAVASSIGAVHDLNALVLKETPTALRESTQHYWQAWISKDEVDITALSAPLKILYQRSLTTMRVHTDNGGAIIASSDTDMLHHGRDTYSYVWPRDGAIVAHAFDIAGYTDVARRFYTFMAARLERGGYLMHKYRSDGVLGSSWHPWIINGEAEFPIQEDETALLIYHMAQHYQLTEDLEYIEEHYNPFIEPAANFLVEFVESRLGLPQASFDLWEEKFGTHTYTASVVFAALQAAAALAQLLGKEEPARTYFAVAQRIQGAIMSTLFKEDYGMFAKSVRAESSGDDTFDNTIDMSSFFGPWYFGVVDVGDPRIKRAFETIEDKLRVRERSDGYVRYQGDAYYTMQDANSPNPWVVTTLWVAQYHIKKATKVSELARAFELLEWTASHATRSGVLAEQMHPRTREHLSTAPLIWSHAEYVLTCRAYCDALRELSEAAGSKTRQ